MGIYTFSFSISSQYIAGQIPVSELGSELLIYGSNFLVCVGVRTTTTTATKDS
jgi:hypothetical protein